MDLAFFCSPWVCRKNQSQNTVSGRLIQQYLSSTLSLLLFKVTEGERSYVLQFRISINTYLNAVIYTKYT